MTASNEKASRRKAKQEARETKNAAARRDAWFGKIFSYAFLTFTVLAFLCTVFVIASGVSSPPEAPKPAPSTITDVKVDQRTNRVSITIKPNTTEKVHYALWSSPTLLGSNWTFTGKTGS